MISIILNGFLMLYFLLGVTVNFQVIKLTKVSRSKLSMINRELQSVFVFLPSVEHIVKSSRVSAKYILISFDLVAL